MFPSCVKLVKIDEERNATCNGVLVPIFTSKTLYWQCIEVDEHRVGKAATSKVALKESDTPTKRFKRPSLAEVIAYKNERKTTGIDPRKFLDHYDASGWMRGKNPVKDWKACWRTWEGRETEEDATLRKKEADIKRQTVKMCAVCRNSKREPFSELCKKCSWCLICDGEGRPSKHLSSSLAPCNGGAKCRVDCRILCL